LRVFLFKGQRATREKMQRTYASDNRMANKSSGLKKATEGCTWHHTEDGVTMQLVPCDLHDAVGHGGGEWRQKSLLYPNEIRMEKPRRPLLEEDIDRAERKLGVTFPQEYRVFLMEFNGGRPTPDLFSIKSDDPYMSCDVMNWFYCISDGDDIDLVSKAGTFKGRVPYGLLPIGDDPFGNQICLCLKESALKEGAVYFWDHEFGAPNHEEPWYENVYPIADSFEQFLDSLYGDSTTM
jgi:hypothetical protein